MIAIRWEVDRWAEIPLIGLANGAGNQGDCRRKFGHEVRRS